MKSNNIKKIAARALFVAVGTVLWVYALLLLIALADQLFGFHPEALVHRIQEAGGITYSPTPLIVAVPAVFLSLVAVKTRSNRRLFYTWWVPIVIVLAMIIALAAFCCWNCSNFVCPGRVKACGGVKLGWLFIDTSGCCECYPPSLIIPLIEALSGVL